MKKNSYSSRKFFIKEVAKSNNTNIQGACKVIDYLINSGDIKGSDISHVTSIINIELSIIESKNNNIIYVVDPDLIDLMFESMPKTGVKSINNKFLIDSVVSDNKTYTLNSNMKHSEMTDDDYLQNYNNLVSDDTHKYFKKRNRFNFVVKHKNKKYSDIIITVIADEANTIDFIMYAEDSIGFYHTGLITKDKILKAKESAFISNFFLYLYAFPEKIREGVPKDYLFKNEGIQGKRFGLETHPSMIDHSSPIPHVRRGHFRELRNERFGENIGKVIWINETFVKGNAKTIEE